MPLAADQEATVTNHRPFPIGSGIAVLCVALTAACGSVADGTSAPPSAKPQSGAPVPGTTATAAGTPSASAVSAQTCTSEQLTVRSDGSGTTAGHSVLVIEITNNGTASCTLSGFPTVVGTLQSGTVVHGVDTTHVFIGMANPGSSRSPVTLAPGGGAWVPLNFIDTPVNGAASCPSFSSFTITPPGLSRTYTVEAAGNGAGDPPDCEGIEVPPVLSAADAVIPSSS
jgi:hypothetical protein